MTLSELRSQHPRFIYQKYSARIVDQNLELSFSFHIEPDITFNPTVTIHGVTEQQWQSLPKATRNNLVFHLGLAEIPSYWKASCSPKIIIEAGFINEWQIDWWSDLLIQGMGEFFYVNDIDFTAPDFVTISSQHGGTAEPAQLPPLAKTTSGETRSTLVPVGGGKDSALTLCLFDKHHLEYDCLLLNPTPAMKELVTLSNPNKVITVSRTIDPLLLELNNKGYLNGHTPFSSYLAFLGIFVATISGNDRIALSNEHSSNEGNVEFHGRTVNHQYSKTFEFEQRFQRYIKRSIDISKSQTSEQKPSPFYFSFLRPLYELQIARTFTKCPNFSQFATAFRSCNRGQKTNSWCGQCSKCLFTFISLLPFTSEEQLTDIFGTNLLEDENLRETALELMGKGDHKPFECVGTHEENIVAFYICAEWYRQGNRSLPVLLKLVSQQVLAGESKLKQRSDQLLQSWNPDHSLPADLEQMLKLEVK